jgi:Family of unknown function (DUF5670)
MSFFSRLGGSSGGTDPPLTSRTALAKDYPSWSLDEVHVRVLANEHRGVDMLWAIFVVVMFLWFLGFTLHIAGGLIDLFLVVGLVILVINLLGRHRSADFR